MNAPDAKLNVLVVDDNDGNRDLFSRLMRVAGFDCSTARSGAEALNFLRNVKPDLVILDYHMPELDGIDVLVQMRANSALADVRVILYTGATEKDLEARARAAGADAVVIKGSDSRALYETIQEVTGRPLSFGVPAAPKLSEGERERGLTP